MWYRAVMLDERHRIRIVLVFAFDIVRAKVWAFAHTPMTWRLVIIKAAETF